MDVSFGVENFKEGIPNLFAKCEQHIRTHGISSLVDAEFIREAIQGIDSSAFFRIDKTVTAPWKKMRLLYPHGARLLSPWMSSSYKTAYMQLNQEYHSDGARYYLFNQLIPLDYCSITADEEQRIEDVITTRGYYVDGGKIVWLSPLRKRLVYLEESVFLEYLAEKAIDVIVVERSSTSKSIPYRYYVDSSHFRIVAEIRDLFFVSRVEP